MIKKFIGVNSETVYIDTELVKGVIIDSAHADNPQLVFILSTGHSLQVCWATHAQEVEQQFEKAIQVGNYETALDYSV